jgi:hypothetical protein
MQIEYNHINRQGLEKSYKESIDDWIGYNLKCGGIESQLYKLIELISIIGAKHLIDNPNDLHKIISAIGSEGYDHRVVNNDS